MVKDLHMRTTESMLSNLHDNNFVYCPDMSKFKNSQRLFESADSRELLDCLTAACFNAPILLL